MHKVDAAENTAYSFLSSDYLFTKYYTMDPVNQATKALTARNNANDMYFVNLAADIVPRIESYTPKASFQNKNLFFNKTLLDSTKPNKVTMTLGRKGTCSTVNDATRCFNWLSVGYYDEYLWLRAKLTNDSYTDWQKIESFKSETGVRKYYNRIRAITTDGTAFTSHKVIVKNLGVKSDIEGVNIEYYEYYVGRNETYKSDIRKFKILTDEQANNTTISFVQTSDQQGFNWDEYNVWRNKNTCGRNLLIFSGMHNASESSDDAQWQIQNDRPFLNRPKVHSS
jgi:hypothetical protein